jgi:2,4-dienoyl-CoA reductase-like NADH-dependent reductase (Old Yellow Enzyme family)
MSKLFSSLKLRDVEFRNRIFLSPMCQYSAVDGMPGTWHTTHYGTRAAGGAALVMLEATGVCPAGRISPFDLGLWADTHIEAYAPIVRFVREQGAVPGVQLAHAGRKASTGAPWLGGKPLPPGSGGWLPFAPSTLPFAPGYAVPHALSEMEIGQVVNIFRKAAERALAAGFEVVEIHMAHGYLLHEFLSPLTNQRNDNYGGSLENRARLPLAVVDAVRAVWPERLPLFVRISATDWVESGWDLPQSVQLSRWLKQRGVDLIDCSSGGLVADAQMPLAPGFQVPFATAIKEQAGINVGAVGLITQAAQAEQIIARNQADAVFLGRELLRNPYWPLQAARELGVEVAWPKQYQRARP